MIEATFIKSFVGEAVMLHADPVKAAVDSAMKQFDRWVDEKLGQNLIPRVISMNTHILAHGDYFSYILTVAVELVDTTAEDEEGGSQ